MPGVATATELDAVLADIVERLRGGIRVDAVVLYGSYVNGKPHEWSDIDLAVISPDFDGIRMGRRQHVLARLLAGADARVEALGYSSSEYHDPERVSFLSEILRTGKVVYEADRDGDGRSQE